MKIPSQTTSLLVSFAGPLLLAAGVSAADDSKDWSSPFQTNPAPSPVADSYGSPTEIYPDTDDIYSADDEAYETYEEKMDYMPAESEGEDKNGESSQMPMDDKPAGGSCSTYDDDVHTASLLAETCEWNIYMCCWTGNDGPGDHVSNTDVCRVLDYPYEGDVLELPRDDEGAVYCHGFAWENGADTSSVILPLLHYVKNYGRTPEGGYYGNVEGAPECGCIEEMPVVSMSACSRHSRFGIEPCREDDLYKDYRSRLDEPKGAMDWNLVKECDNGDTPDYDYRSCKHNTYMCCWTENSNGEMADNTDVCEYAGDSEGEVHCHGFVWPEDASDGYINVLAQYVQNFDHRDGRGYYGNLPGAPMCGCIEEMPIVSEADCTTYNDEEGPRKFKACDKNDLRTRYEEEYPTADLQNLVGKCE